MYQANPRPISLIQSMAEPHARLRRHQGGNPCRILAGTPQTQATRLAILPTIRGSPWHCCSFIPVVSGSIATFGNALKPLGGLKQLCLHPIYWAVARVINPPLPTPLICGPINWRPLFRLLSSGLWLPWCRGRSCPWPCGWRSEYPSGA